MHVTFTRSGIVTGLRAAMPLAIPVAMYGAVYGVLARQAGATALEAMLLNVFVFAGASQMAVMQYWQHPLPLLMIAVTAFLINLRLIMLSASIRPWMNSIPSRITYPVLHILSDESWAVAMTRYRLGERDAGVVLGCNLSILFGWFPATLVGFAAGGRIGDPEKWGLDFAFTAVFAAMLFSGYRSKRDLAPWIASAVVSALVWWAVDGTWYVVAGGLAGVAVAIFRTDEREHVAVPEAEVAP